MKNLVALLTAMTLPFALTTRMEALEAYTKGQDEQSEIQAKALGEDPPFPKKKGHKPAQGQTAPANSKPAQTNSSSGQTEETNAKQAPSNEQASATTSNAGTEPNTPAYAGTEPNTPADAGQPADTASCCTYEDVRSNTYAMPAFAIGSIAVIAIIAVSVQNANSGHPKHHSSHH